MKNTVIKSKVSKKKSLNENSLCITKSKKDLFIDGLIEAIQTANPKDWEHFVKDKAYADLVPHNPFSGTKYIRSNKLYLMLISLIRGYSSNRFATFKQISNANYKIKKGAKGALVEYFNFMIVHKESNQKISMEKYRKLSDAEKENYTKRTFTKTYRVFNLDDVEGLNPEDFDTIQDEFEPIEEIDKYMNDIIKSHPIQVDYKRTDKAYYSRKTDSITLPLKKYFENSERYYSTIFHEMIHWSGNEKRLDRDLSGSFGNEKYAFEELIAELGSLLCLTNLNIYSEVPNSLAYLKGWLSATKVDENETLNAAMIKAKQAINYLEKHIL